jgi:hypothetical protein
MGWKVEEGGVASNGVPFMAPLVCDPCLNIPSDEATWQCSSLGSFELITSLHQRVYLPSQSLDLRLMVECSLKLSDGSTDHGNCGRCRWGSGSRGLERNAAEARQGGG